MPNKHYGHIPGTRFPNVVTGFNVDPAQASRTALYTRYTPSDWLQSNINQICSSKNVRMISERLRGDSVNLIMKLDTDVIRGQRESTKRLGDRVIDTTQWKEDLRTELEANVSESERLQESRAALERAHKETDGPLHVVQENLYHREKREGIDMVHDKVEQGLLRELDVIRTSRDKLKSAIDRVNCQLGVNRAARHELERDFANKEQAWCIDASCLELSTNSKSIAHRPGIETLDPTVSMPETWADFSYTNIQRSQAERAKSQHMRVEADNDICTTFNNMWEVWTNTTESLAHRSRETQEAKSNLEHSLHKINLEIYDIERNMAVLRKSLADKSAPLQLAQTRLENRLHRPAIELCRDPAHINLVHEVYDINDMVEQLQRKLREAEVIHQKMLKSRSDLEHDIQVKAKSLFIDREKCLSMRKSFPISTAIVSR